MPAGRKKQPVVQITLDLKSEDDSLKNFCDYYKSECGRKAGDPKKNKNGEILDGEPLKYDVPGDFANYLKGILSYALETGSVPDTFVEHAEKAIAWKAATSGDLKSRIQFKAKSNPEVAKALEALKKEGLL